MKSNLVSKSETADILASASEDWGITIPKIKNLMVYEIDSESQVIVGGSTRMIKTDGAYLPFLSDVETLARFPSVTVDMGAVKFVCKGADIMRPGITGSTDFESGGIVCVIEESQKKFLAVGRALVGSSEMDGMEKGQIIRNIHYISDKFWQAAKSV
ncbi:MAG: RNA-binding protein [Nitrosopumilus sp. H8]|nr:MAG: RNA-binding protein [Nitrosopumilus sp. H8]